MGSSLIFESRFDRKDQENMSEEDRNKCHKIGGAKVLGIQLEKDSNDCKRNTTNSEKTSKHSVDKFQQKSKGSFPPVDRDGALSEWNSKVQEQVGTGKYVGSEEFFARKKILRGKGCFLRKENFENLQV